jgi:hypothetical protein
MDKRWGVDGSISRQARRMVTLAGASWSFDCAARNLRELCGWSVCDNTIRAVCHEQAPEVSRWQGEDPRAHESFHKASGEIEFTTDGTMINTTRGWREMRLGIFAKRPRGLPASAQEWERRKLPDTTVRTAFAAIEASAPFGRRWTRWTHRLGIQDTTKVSVLADGARWIWDESAQHLPGATEVLDIFHALEHVAAAAKTLYGEGTAQAKAWHEEIRAILLTKGWPGVRACLARTRAATRKPAGRKALDKLAGYLGRQPEHLCYATRLAAGLSIGSGQVEGACKNMIGRRLKNGARWRVRRANRMATLCALLYSDQWDT